MSEGVSETGNAKFTFPRNIIASCGNLVATMFFASSTLAAFASIGGFGIYQAQAQSAPAPQYMFNQAGLEETAN